MTPRTLTVAVAALALTAAQGVASKPPAVFPVTSPPSLDVCSTAVQPIDTRTYDVRGRVKMLLFWTGAHSQGTARIIRSAGAGNTRRRELLIGTDPDRAFRKMNRWGYIAETVCDRGAEVVGVMSASDEASIDEARARLDAAASTDEHAFRAIRARVVAGQSVASVLRVSTAQDFTYRDLQQLLGRLPGQGTERTTRLPENADAGFLAAVSHVLETAVASTGSGQRVTGTTRSYVYGATNYRLRLTSVKNRQELKLGDVRYANPVETEFEVFNLATRETTEFEIVAGTTGDVSGVPLQIIYRPRWWLQIELALAETR